MRADWRVRKLLGVQGQLTPRKMLIPCQLDDGGRVFKKHASWWCKWCKFSWYSPSCSKSSEPIGKPTGGPASHNRNWRPHHVDSSSNHTGRSPYGKAGIPLAPCLGSGWADLVPPAVLDFLGK